MTYLITITILKRFYREYSSVLDAASKGASLALEVVLGIISNLIAFIAFIFFVNGVLSWLGGLVGSRINKNGLMRFKEQ